MSALVIVRVLIQPRLTHVPAKIGDRTLRYFFHFLNKGLLHEDKDGDHFDSAEEAVAYARVIAFEIGNDDATYADHVVLVTDAKGKEIGRVPIGSVQMSGEEDLGPQ
jgi:hypothetical protein